MLRTLLLALGMYMTTASAQSPDIRYVVIHRAGHAWVPGVSLFDQPYILSNPNGQNDQTHVKYFASLLAAGKLAMGGPFPSSSGTVGSEVGMMIPAPGISFTDVTNFASNDPAVKAGVLDFEVRPWMVGMSTPCRKDQ